MGDSIRRLSVIGRCRKTAQFLLPFLVLIVPHLVVSQEGGQACGSVYERVSRFVLEADYKGAEAFLDSCIASKPDELCCYLFKAAVIHYAATDYEDFSRAEDFHYLLDSVDRLSSARLKTAPDDVLNRYWRAASESMRGSWKANDGGLLGGIVTARSGARSMEAIVRADSTFFDAYLMTGSYRFWRGVAIGKMPVVSFDKRDAEAALHDVDIAIQKGTFTGPLSNTVLMEMLLIYDPERAVSRGENLIGDYPGCRLFAWQLGEAYKKLGRFDDAEGVFTRIAESMARDPLDKGVGQLRCFWKLAVCADDTGNKEKCVYYCNKVLSLKEGAAGSKSAADRVGKARRMLTKYEKH